MLAAFSFLKPVFSFLQNANLKAMFLGLITACPKTKIVLCKKKTRCFQKEEVKKEGGIARSGMGDTDIPVAPRFCSRRSEPWAAHEDLSAGQGGAGEELRCHPSIPAPGGAGNALRAWRACDSTVSHVLCYPRVPFRAICSEGGQVYCLRVTRQKRKPGGGVVAPVGDISDKQQAASLALERVRVRCPAGGAARLCPLNHVRSCGTQQRPPALHKGRGVSNCRTGCSCYCSDHYR